MTKERYKEIRNLPNFLHVYFMEVSGRSINPQEFDQSITNWLLLSVGISPNIGVNKILSFLDTKFA